MTLRPKADTLPITQHQDTSPNSIPADASSRTVVRVEAAVVRTLAERILSTTLLPLHEQIAIVEALLDAECFGRPGHGLLRLPAIVEAARRHGPTQVRLLKDGGHLLLAEGDSGNGYYLARWCIDLATDRALKHGSAVLALRGGSHCGMVSHYVSRAIARDVAAVFVCNCSPRVAPHGSVERLFGTNPFCVGLPGDPDPLVLDLATSAATTGDLLSARQRGAPVSAGVAVDGEGRPTVDPEEALAGALLTFGGHRGSAVALAIQALSTAVSGAALQPQPGADYGFWLHLLAPGFFRPIADFKRDVGRLMSAVRATRPADPACPVRCPGDRATACRARALTEGLEVDAQLWNQLLAQTNSPPPRDQQPQ